MPISNTRPLAALLDADLHVRIGDARREFEAAYAHFQATGNPHDRDAATLWQSVFLDALRERRARTFCVGVVA